MLIDKRRWHAKFQRLRFQFDGDRAKKPLKFCKNLQGNFHHFWAVFWLYLRQIEASSAEILHVIFFCQWATFILIKVFIRLPNKNFHSKKWPYCDGGDFKFFTKIISGPPRHQIYVGHSWGFLFDLINFVGHCAKFIYTAEIEKYIRHFYVQ